MKQYGAKLDENAYKILMDKRDELRREGVGGASISDAVRALRGAEKKCR
jgi:hypothetical protein